MIVHSYTRFSHSSQADGDSVRRQVEAAEAFCARRGFQLSDERFLDSGRSGFKGNKQKALKAFVDAITDGRVKPGEMLLVEAVDRLSRKGVRPTQDLVNSILNAGVHIAILSPIEKIYRADDSNDIGGAIELAAFAYQASVYSENLSMRVKAVNSVARARRRSGERVKLSQIAPSWLTWDHKANKFITKPEAVKAIRYIFKRTIEGVGRKRLAQEMNEKFKPIATRKNCRAWNEQFLTNVLTGRSVLGEMTSTTTGEIFTDYYPPIIDQKTWKQAQIAYSSRRLDRGPQTKNVNLFNGLLHCAVDDCPYGLYLTKPNGKRSVRYRSYRRSHGEQGASSETILVDRLEDLIFKFLPTIELGKSGRSEYQRLIDERDYLVGEIESCQQAIENRSKSVSALLPTMERLQVQLDAIDKQLAGTSSQAKEPTKAYREKLSKMRRGTNEERRLVRDGIRSIVKRIELLLVKTGPHRNSHTKALLQIEFKNGAFVRAVETDTGLVRIGGAQIHESLTSQIQAGFRFGFQEWRRVCRLASSQ